MMEFVLVRKKIKIRSDTTFIARFHPTLSFDKRRLQQVLLNLLSNASKFQKKGVIKVKVEIEGDAEERELSLLVTVMDQGIGLQPDELEKVFNTFWCSKRKIS